MIVPAECRLIDCPVEPVTIYSCDLQPDLAVTCVVQSVAGVGVVGIINRVGDYPQHPQQAVWVW